MGFNQKNRRNDFGLYAICGFRPPETFPVIGYELPRGSYFRGRQEMVVVRETSLNIGGGAYWKALATC
jgi:hypothetical protein